MPIMPNIAISLFAVFSTFALANEKLLATGSSTVAPLVAELAKQFEKKTPNILLEVQTGGSARGITDCRDHLNDIGMISRSLKDDETDVTAIPIARDGLAFIVHESNPIRKLTREQVVKIFSGQITKWKELGGKDAKIFVMSKAEGRAALELFMHYFDLKSSQIKASVIIGDEEQGIKTVANNPNAIGYLSVSTAENAVNSKSRILTLSLDGQKPTMGAVRNREYNLSRYLNLVVCGKAKASAQKFIDYVISSEGQSVIEKLKYIPL
ncbi:MAG: phosphate ABC transporter substrate-binding protein [Bdellovibrionales bacterium]|nr:phosphate ABC transporter substrate-binding protein [Bdellovibrionales bacterium]